MRHSNTANPSLKHCSTLRWAYYTASAQVDIQTHNIFCMLQNVICERRCVLACVLQQRNGARCHPPTVCGALLCAAYVSCYSSSKAGANPAPKLARCLRSIYVWRGDRWPVALHVVYLDSIEPALDLEYSTVYCITPQDIPFKTALLARKFRSFARHGCRDP